MAKRRRIRTAATKTISCAECGGAFQTTRKTFHSLWRCDHCKLQRRKEYVRRLPKAKIPLGTKILCEGCASPIIRTSGTRRFCRPCKIKHSIKTNRQRQIDYRARNQKQIRTRKRQRLISDPAYAIASRMSCAIRRSLKSGKNGKPWEQIVGYTREELMKHLERQFSGSMSWKNYGKWEIDHIRPLSSFVISGTDDPEFKAAWSLTNLRPLWAADNNRKSAKRIFLI